MHLALHAGVTLLVKRIVPKHDTDIIRVGVLKFQQGVSGSGTLRAAEINKLVNGQHRVRRTLDVPFRATQHHGRLVVVIAHKTHVHLCWRRREIFLKGGDVGGLLCLGQADTQQHDGKAQRGVRQPRQSHRPVCPVLHNGTHQEAQVDHIQTGTQGTDCPYREERDRRHIQREDKHPAAQQDGQARHGQEGAGEEDHIAPRGQDSNRNPKEAGIGAAQD